MPDPGHLFVGLLVSSIGFVMLMYGRKQRRAPQMGAGLLLLALPFLVRDALWLGLASAVVCGGAWFAVRAGL